ncbi:MAG: hypothetical protein UFX72_11585, partial [Adlercreutzia sp.]|nr:hypothetical protein [Adlercreutzia sp.]
MKQSAITSTGTLRGEAKSPLLSCPKLTYVAASPRAYTSTSRSEKTHRQRFMHRNSATKQQIPYPITHNASSLVKRNPRHDATDSTDEAPLAQAAIMQTAQKNPSTGEKLRESKLPSTSRY